MSNAADGRWALDRRWQAYVWRTSHQYTACWGSGCDYRDWDRKQAREAPAVATRRPAPWFAVAQLAF